MKPGNLSEKKAQKGKWLTKSSLRMGPTSAVLTGCIDVALQPASPALDPQQQNSPHPGAACPCAVCTSNYRKALPLQEMRSCHMPFQKAFRTTAYSTFPIFLNPRQHASQMLGISPSFCRFSQTMLSASSLLANWHYFPDLGTAWDFSEGEWRWQRLCHGGAKPG